MYMYMAMLRVRISISPLKFQCVHVYGAGELNVFPSIPLLLSSDPLCVCCRILDGHWTAQRLPTRHGPPSLTLETERSSQTGRWRNLRRKCTSGEQSKLSYHVLWFHNYGHLQKKLLPPLDFHKWKLKIINEWHYKLHVMPKFQRVSFAPS